jgi:ATP-binding protein involved in chromosome partitioning
MPVEIIGLGKPTVEIVWSDEPRVADTWSAHELRCRCTCAYCQSETTGERILDPATVPADITITDMTLVGNYGLAVYFSDGHTTGIYRFRELHAARRGTP